MRFKITEDDKNLAQSYLCNKLKNEPLYLEHMDSLKVEEKAKDEFRALFKATSVSAEGLDTWCKKYLTNKQFNALRAALRKTKSRRSNSYLAVELTRESYANLNDLAASEGINIKDCLAMLIQDKYNDVNPPTASLASQRRRKKGNV